MADKRLVIGLSVTENAINVNGVFSLDKNDGLYLDGEIYKKLVMIVSYNNGYQVITPFLEKVVFEDDVNRTSKSVTGSFSFTLNELFSKLERENYYILFSLGPYLSNIVTFKAAQ